MSLNFPFLCVPYAVGLVIGFYFPAPFHVATALCFAAGCAALLLTAYRTTLSIPSFFVFALTFGVFMGLTPYLPSSPTHVEHYAETRATFLARVLEPPAPREEGIRMKVECLSVFLRGMHKPCTGITFVYDKKVQPLRAGDIVKITGSVSRPLPARNPGEFSFQTYLLARGIRAVTYAQNIEKIRSGSAFSFKRLSFHLRDAFISVYNETLPHSYSTMLTAFIFDSQAVYIPREIVDIFRRAGILHLMVASGAQISLLLGICLCLTKLPVKQGIVFKLSVASVSFLFLLAYTFMTQGGFSILRAFIMGCVLLIALTAERDYNTTDALFYSALLIIILHPLALLDAGFQLSFAATFGIIYLSPKFYALFKKKFKKPSRTTIFFAMIVFVTISVHLFVAPFIIFYISALSAFWLVTNLIALPLAGFLVPLGFLTGLAGTASLFLAKLPASVCGFFLYIIYGAVKLVAAIPFGMFEIARPSPIFYASYYFAIVYFAERDFFLKKFHFLTPARASLLLLVLNFLPAGKPHIVPAPLKVVFFDIGQGDSALIEAPDGAHILIDGGGSGHGQSANPGERTLVPYMKREGIRRIDLAVLTHPHRDHLEGLLAVLNERHVNQLLYSSLSCDQPFCDALQSLIQNKKIKTLKAVRGTKFAVGKGVTLTVLHPDIKPLSDTQSDIDNNSVAVLLQYKNVRFLFPGDIYKDGENSLLKSGAYLRADVLKAPHHGSRHSSTLPFLRMLKPRITVISCGRRNVFRHPSKQTLQNLSLSRSLIYRTDTNGAVIVETDGEKIWAETMY